MGSNPRCEKVGKFEILMPPLCQPPHFWCVSDVGFARPQLTDAFPTAFNSRKTCPELQNSFQSKHFLKPGRGAKLPGYLSVVEQNVYFSSTLM